MNKFFSIALVCAVAVMIAMTFTMASCSKGGGEEPDPPAPPEKIETKRYVTVPYRTTGESRAFVEEDYLLVYSKIDKDNYYFVYYGGRIDYVPLVYQQAVVYNGVTPITVGYSKDTSVETAVSRGVAKAVEESFEVSESLEISIGVSASAGFFGNGVEVSTEVSVGVSTTFGGSVSTTDSYETSEAKISGESFSTEATIGTAGEPAGMYRYALFSSTDVFYNVRVERQTGKIVELTVALCARPVTYWGVDYDPELGGSNTFGKTGEGDKLQVPVFDPDKIPVTAVLDAPTISLSLAAQSPHLNGSSTIVYFLCDNAYPIGEQQVTYYITYDGSDPTKESHSLTTAKGTRSACTDQFYTGYPNYSDPEILKLLPAKSTSGSYYPGDTFYDPYYYHEKVTVKAFASMQGTLDSPIAEKECEIWYTHN